MQAMDPMFMEPESGIAWFDQRRKQMNLVLGTQSPDHDAAHIAEMYSGCPDIFSLEHVAITSCYPGGGFGGRDSSPFSLMLALAAGYAEGNPVKLDYDRFEQFRVGLKRHASTVQGALAVDANMKLQLLDVTMEFDGGGRRNMSPYVASLAALCAGGAYVIPKSTIHSQSNHSINVSGGSQRGFGGPQAFFALETAIDELARSQGWDPFALRRANLLTQGDKTVVGGPILEPLRLDEILSTLENHPLWQDREAIKAKFQRENKWYGTGIALSMEAYGTSGDGVVAEVSLKPDGSVHVTSDAVDMGNGSATTLSVAVADYLDVNAASVTMGDSLLFGQTGLLTGHKKGDPDFASWRNPLWTQKGTGSSSACLTAFHQVHVVKEAARALFELSILPAAQAVWKACNLTPEQVEWRDGALVLKNTSRRPLPLTELAERIIDTRLPIGCLGHAFFQGKWVTADYTVNRNTYHFALDGLTLKFSPPSPASSLSPPSPQHIWRANTQPPEKDAYKYSRTLFSPCANLISLTVDPQTFEVQVQNSVTVLDAGKVIVKQLVSGQSQGGLAMALGYSLLEDMPPGMDGPANGKWNLNRYHVPKAADLPLANRGQGSRYQELITLPPTDGNKLSKGIAEAVMCSVAPAVSNALRDAIDLRIMDLPITKDKIAARIKL